MKKASILVARALVHILICTAASRVASAEFKLGTLFQDHMVLQREKPINVWGWADAGDKVAVSLGGSSASAVADASGKWTATLPAMPAGLPGRGQGVSVRRRRESLHHHRWEGGCIPET